MNFSIKTSDELLVLGDLKMGIAIFGIVQRTMEGAIDLFRGVDLIMRPEQSHKSGTSDKTGMRHILTKEVFGMYINAVFTGDSS